MDIEEVRTYCLSLKATNESFPFGEDTLVFKVFTKIYCLESLESKSINLKAAPEDVTRLIEEYSGIFPGFHMNKTHWVTIHLEEIFDDNLLKQLITNSYHLIVSKMTRKDKLKLNSF